MTVEFLEQNNLILFRAYRGSKAYGTFIEGRSDLDEVIIYINPIEELLGLNYLNQVNENKNDTVGYEIGRFLQLLFKSNPTVCEALWSPEDCIIYKHPIMDELIKVRDMFLTKAMKHSFGGYAIQQIRKADGMDKKMHWEKQGKGKRADVLEFCRVPHAQGTVLVEEWLGEKGLKQEYCGLVKLPHMRDTYGVYYDIAQHCQFEKLGYKTYLSLYDSLCGDLRGAGSEEEYNSTIMDGQFKNLKYKGIVQDKITSNSISLSSTPKGAISITTLTYNKDAYTIACGEHRSFLKWKEERNTERYVDVEGHGQQIDGKNMLHCVRLLRMSREIASGKGLIMRRPDADYLLEIRAGKHNLAKLKEECEVILLENDKMFDESDLPANVDRDFVNNLLIKMRKEFYGI